MLYIDVGNTLRGGLRTGIQRVVRSLSYELAANSPTTTRLIAFDVSASRYFALADPSLIRSADSLADIAREARVYLDLEAKTRRTRDALAQARRSEIKGGGAHSPGLLALAVTPNALKFVGSGTILAGKRNVRRILLVNGVPNVTSITGRLEMFVTEPRGTPVVGESVRLSEVYWIPLLPPDKPGL